MKTKNQIELEKEFLIQVDGESEKNHTISWDTLKKLGDSTQKLILSLVKSLDSDTIISEENVKLEFTGFYKGSSITGFRLQDRQLLFPIVEEQKLLNDKFSDVFSCLSNGNFNKIASDVKDPILKNEIINSVYEFSNSAGNSPINIVKKSGDKYKPTYKIRKISSEQKKDLLTPINNLKELVNTLDNSKTNAFGKISIKKTPRGRVSRKVVSEYSDKDAILSLIFDSIEYNSKLYQFTHAITFTISHDDPKFKIIENPMLDIYAQGNTIEEAKIDMYEQFDYTFQRLSNISDNKLSSHLLKAKKYLKLIIENVTNV